MDKPGSRFYRIYVCVALFIIIILLGSLVGALVYGSMKVKTESTTIDSKVNSFNQSMNTVNKNLQNINSQLQKQNNTIETQSIPKL